MIKRILFMALALGFSLFASTDTVDALEQSRIERLEEAVTRVISKAGIHLGGTFRSQFLLSRLESGVAVNESAKKDEYVQFTSVDFDFNMRPNTAAQGRLILRLHQDWRNFFSSMKSPVYARWISMGGNIKNIVKYEVGDFRQKYSPLTMWSPDINIFFEPEIFSRLKKKVMDEEFLGYNERILQGVNVNFDAQIKPVWEEFHWNFMGARLRSAGSAPGVGGNSVATEIEAKDVLMDKMVLGSHLDMMFLPDFILGGTVLSIFERRNTYGGSLDSADLVRQDTRVFGGHLGVGTAPFIDKKKINVCLNGEFALSMDRADAHFPIISIVDTSSAFPPDTILDTTIVEYTTVKGTAIDGGIDVEIALGSIGKAMLSVGYLQNGRDYRNELAQSPTLAQKRIMNTSNDPELGLLYSTFDVLYRNVFKYTPSAYEYNANNNEFFKGPQNKIAYTNTVFNQSEMRNDIKLDTALTLVMPYGQATPNRKGVHGGFGFELFNKMLIIDLQAKSLKEIDQRHLALGIDSVGGLGGNVYMFDHQVSTDLVMQYIGQTPQTEFLDFKGGASINVAKIGDWWPHPFIVSAGYSYASALNSGVTGFAKTKSKVVTDFINGSLYWTFWKRASLLGGVQLITTDIDGLFNDILISKDQFHWAVGLEYKVAKGGILTGSFGFTDVTFTSDDEALTQIVKNDNFRQWQTDLYFTVNF